jgi:SAM-dependent methyltransferase
MINIKKIDIYSSYISLQKEKTEDPVRRKKWQSALKENTKKFLPTFKQYDDILSGHKEENVYCLGARTGEEVLALRVLGFKKTLGTDLVPFMEHVIEDDIHDMKFADNSVGLFYTNIFDHSIDPNKFIDEAIRCLRPEGKIFLQLQLGNDLDKYGVLYIEKPEDFYDLISDKNVKIIKSEKNKVLTPHNHALNWNIILEKNE